MQNSCLTEDFCSQLDRFHIPATNSEVGDGVEIRLEHIRVSEHLVSEGVDAVQHDSDVRRSHPVLDTVGTDVTLFSQTMSPAGHGLHSTTMTLGSIVDNDHG